MNFLIAIKEFIFDWCKKITTVWESSFLWQYVKEKYLCLSFLHRKILHSVLILGLLIGVFYFPLSLLWHSKQYIKEFRDKKHLVEQLNNLSVVLKRSQSSILARKGNLSSFVKRRISYWSGAKNQLVRVQLMRGNWKKTYRSVKSPSLKKGGEFSDRQKKAGSVLSPQQMVRVEMDNLNIQEVVRYGRKLEQLSPHFKLLGLNMEEDKTKENYFDVSYALAVFDNQSSELKTPHKAGGKTPQKLFNKKFNHKKRAIKKPVRKIYQNRGNK